MEKKLLSAIVVALAAFTFILCISEANSQDTCGENCTIHVNLQRLINNLRILQIQQLLSDLLPDLQNQVLSLISLSLNISLPDLLGLGVNVYTTPTDLQDLIKCLQDVLSGRTPGCALNNVLNCVENLLNNTQVNNLTLPAGLCVDI